MRTIHRYKLDLQEHNTIRSHFGAKPFHFGTGQSIYGEKLFIWVEVDTDAPKHNLQIIIQGADTKSHEPDRRTYIGTIHHHGHVWHAFYFNPNKQ